MTPDVWVVVPAYNEAPRLADTLAALIRTSYQIAVVDDGSEDGTAEVALRFPVWVLRHATNRGQGAALATGWRFALAQGAAFIVTFDADGQHAAEDLEPLLAPVRSGAADVALGSRFLGRAPGLPHGRRLLLRLAVRFTRLTTGLALTDTHNGLRAFTRHAALRIRLRQDRMAHASEILSEIRRHGLRWTEVPVTIRYSAASLAKGQRARGAARILADLLAGRLVP
jgi:glycosyltransferase involved in cell wall biosynthesis